MVDNCSVWATELQGENLPIKGCVRWMGARLGRGQRVVLPAARRRLAGTGMRLCDAHMYWLRGRLISST